MTSSNPTYVPGTGNRYAKLLVLGEAPSHHEVMAGKPFVGPAGKVLDELLQPAGINRADIWTTNVFKYMINPQPKGKNIPAHKRAEAVGINVEESLAELQYELNQIRPNCILALGGTALWALKGTYKIRNYRGSILHGMGYKFVPTYHPAFLIHSGAEGEAKGYWNKTIMILDVKRAKEQSEFSDVRLPQRQLEICTSSYQLEQFRQRYAKHTKPAVDIEARGRCIPACMGLAFTSNHGMTVPLWNTGEIEEIAKISDNDWINMLIILAQILAENDIVGQNFKYDQDKIARVGFLIKSLASDTMLKSFAINPELPKGLAFNQSILTEEPFYKDEGMYEGSYRDLLIGCARDACVTKEIDLRQDKELDDLDQREWYENFIMHLHQLYLDIENEGLYVDEERRKELITKYVKWSEQLQYELFHLTGVIINTRSHPQVYKLLFEILNLPRRPTTGEEDLSALLQNVGPTGVKDPNKRRAIEVILEKRKVDKTIGTYLMALPDFDGKMKTSYFICLETGRTRTAQQEPPIRPVLNLKTGEWTSKKKQGQDYKEVGAAFQVFTKHGDIGQDVRSMYVPEKGHVFIQADSAQAEARVVFLLADDEQALRDIDEHDYHALTASWFFGGSEDDYSKKKLGYESPIRFVGKTLRHAGHLGAGKRRAALTVNTDARKYKIEVSITEMFAGRALDTFHNKQPKIREVFHKGVINALQRDKRYLVSSVPYNVNAKIGGKRQFFERWGEELFRQAFSYIPQRAVSDNTKAAALRLRRRLRGLRIILEAHDALLFMVRENEVEDFGPIIKEEMERPIRFDTCSLPRRDLIIPCELEIGYNYQELKKFKLKNETVKIPVVEQPKKRFERYENSTNS